MACLRIVSDLCASSMCEVIKYTLEGSGQILIFPKTTIGHLERHRQLCPNSRESGGQLFARFEGKAIWIERATGPRRTDRRTRTTFAPNRGAERREIKRLFKEGLHYVGDWHTHPEPSPYPSQIDIYNFMEMFRESRHKLASFVAVVLGTASLPDGLFVGLCDESGLRELIPD